MTAPDTTGLELANYERSITASARNVGRAQRALEWLKAQPHPASRTQQQMRDRYADVLHARTIWHDYTLAENYHMTKHRYSALLRRALDHAEQGMGV